MCQDGYIPNEFLLAVDIWRAQVFDICKPISIYSMENTGNKYSCI